MKKIIFLIILMVFLSQTQFLSSSASSDDYSVDYSTGISGGQISGDTYNSDFAFIYEGIEDAETTDYLADVGIFSQPAFCGDGACNDNENCGTCPEDCACASGYGCSSGVCVLSTPSGGTGGGGSSCTYDWVCSEWYPEPCPSEGIQKRVCVNRGTCNGIMNMPDIIKNCTPEIILPSEPLFDLFVKVPKKNKWILQGEDVSFDVELINVGNATILDVFFKYWIVDENGRLIAETQETRAIGEKEEFSITIPLIESLNKSIYKVYVQINYDSDKIAIAEDSFEIVDSKFYIIFRRLISFFYIIIPSIILLILILIFFLKRHKKRKSQEIIGNDRYVSPVKSNIKYKEKKKETKPLVRKKTKQPLISSIEKQKHEFEEKIRKKRIKELRKKIGKK